MQIEDLKSAENAACGSLSGDDCGFAIERYILGGAHRLEGVGHGQRQGGESLSIYACLGFGEKETNEDTIRGLS